ncbi:hypothetical protein [Novipirellula artificiosorum]|uniref:Cytochrome c domain-containing protein n=1 Tax=Novipirellula artificiosorum TaxID=2528016 RepID=A0A5C6DYJ2_9BACT|nr:hypothetical protein [Novipirellula artificiosorum]TWU40897.1 hypothetical protein Poly41_17320 [Novipirellula artificiosorum]
MRLISRPRPTVGVLIVAILMIAGGGVSSVAFAQSTHFEKPPISYHDAPVHDRASRLAEGLKSSQKSLVWDEDHGYLKSLLSELEVPISSQTLVFSKTSLQLQRISPRTPRALYFNDDTYVGWCQQGDVVEIAVTDPQQGAIFYTLEQSQSDAPRLVRDRGQCLTCHSSSRTQDVPGYLVRSMFIDPRGYPKFGSGTFLTDYTSKFEERWGGWYVTGTHGEMRHMGNEIASGKDADAKIDREAGANLQDLSDRFDTDRYLSPHSDIVALMVLEHQTQMHNAIAAANYETRMALEQAKQMNELLGRPKDYVSESTQRRLDRAADNVVKHLLMSGEFPLSSRVSGSSSFAEEFSKRGKRDTQGRSLRDFDLSTRLFRYPCSFLIDSEAFDGLPSEVRSRVVQKLLDVLKQRNRDQDYEHLTAELRQQILEILRDVKPQLFAAESS